MSEQSNKLHFCQECQEMTFHASEQHDEWIAEEYYQQISQEESELIQEGMKLIHLTV